MVTEKNDLFWKFRIYPENKSLYFLVYIFKTRKNMQGAIQQYGVRRKYIRKSLQAGVMPLQQKEICGVIFFHQKMIGVSTTTHEIAHAALTWARRVRLDIQKDEERFCEVVGELNRQLTSRCYDLNIYEGEK